jgi:hypothetical protein
MININLRLHFPSTTFEEGTVITVYYKNRTNIIGTCSIQQNEIGTIGAFTVAEDLHDDLYVLYIYGCIKDDVVLEGILFDDSKHNKAINTIGSIKLS